MKSKLLLVFFFTAILNLFRCGCPDYEVIYYNWGNFNISYNRYVKTVDGYWSTAWSIDDTVFHGSSFGMTLNMELLETSELDKKIDFSCSAYAFEKCHPDEYRPKLLISDINFITLNDFDEDHLKNSDITEYFFSVDNPLVAEINRLNYVSGVLHKSLNVRIMKTPTLGSLQSFKIVFKLEDGTILSKKTKEVTLLPEK